MAADNGDVTVGGHTVGFLVRHRRFVQGALDAGAWLVASVAAVAVRYDFHLGDAEVGKLATFAALSAAVGVLAGLANGLYTGRWRFGSFDEIAGLVRAVAVTSLVLVVFDAPSGRRTVPLSAAMATGVIALVMMAAVRYIWRLALEARRRPGGAEIERMLVFGAGDGGAQVITALLRDPASPYLPVALIDDDPAKRHLRINGIRVAGDRTSIAALAREHKADVLLIAVPSADSSVVADVTERASAAGLAVKTLPPVRELFGANVNAGDIRDLTPADLLGRHEIQTDVASIAGYLTGKCVLVTGAGGSIGSELCRQIYRFAPSELVMLDRDESALHAVQLSIHGRALLDTSDVVVADIRDGKRLEQVFEAARPEVVFHAAALKHLPLLEQHPGEGVQTNVWGTLNVLKAAAATGVERFVNISTDKAADPISVLGYTKRITERLTAWFGDQADGTYLSVRFGNVLGSRGSVLTAFQSQIASGGPLTVTDPEVTRYFMTIEEACELVVQAGAIGRNCEALVLDMGEPVRIADVARMLAARAERPTEIVFTGLRPGEKLHEVLFARDEVDARPIHPLVSHVGVGGLNPVDALALDPFGEPDDLASNLACLSQTGVRL